MSYLEDEASVFAKSIKKQRTQQFLFGVSLSIFLINLILQASTLFIVYADINRDISGFFKIIVQFLFIFAIILLVVSIVVFIDSIFGLNLFSTSKITMISSLGTIIVVLSLFVSLFSERIFAHPELAEIESILVFVTFILTWLVVSYFLLAGIRFFGKASSLTEDIAEYRNIISKKHVNEMNVPQSIDRGIKWLTQVQAQDGIWGTKYPLYETASVLMMFYELGLPMDYKWTWYGGNEPEERTVEQIYYILLEAVQTMDLDLTFEKLFALLVVALYDPSIIDQNHPVFTENRAQLIGTSEWDFIKKLESFDMNRPLETTPVEFLLGPLYRLIGDVEVAQSLVDSIGATFNLISRRITAAYTKEYSNDIHPYVVSLMYNTMMLLTDDKLVSRVRSASNPPSLAIGSTPIDPPRAHLKNVNLTNAINVIKNLQSLEGYWRGGTIATSEAIKALITQLPLESLEVKLGINFLLSLQQKDGSWSKDIIRTSRVIGTLGRINEKII